MNTSDETALIRYVVTHIGKDGLRTMTWPHQGRHTHATPEEARKAMAALLNVGVNRNDIPGVYGEQAVGTFEVRPVEVYPGHHDPKTRYFEE